MGALSLNKVVKNKVLKVFFLILETFLEKSSKKNQNNQNNPSDKEDRKS